MDKNNRRTLDRVSSSGITSLVSDLDMRLIKMLIILYRAGEKGLNTRALLKEYQSIGPGQELLKDLVKKGFVRRSEVKIEDKKGRGGTHVTMNYITKDGTRYLKNLVDV
jgi:hypothetical protein